MVLHEKYLEVLRSDLELITQVVNGATIHVSELDPARENAGADARLLESLELDPNDVTCFDLACHRLAAGGTADSYDEARLSLLRSCADGLSRWGRTLDIFTESSLGKAVSGDGAETKHCGSE